LVIKTKAWFFGKHEELTYWSFTEQNV